MTTALRRFRRKPVEVEAVQLPVWDQPNAPAADRIWESGSFNDIFDSLTYVDTCIAIAAWCGGKSHMMVAPGELAYSEASVLGPHIAIPHAHGQTYAYPGWWIIRDGNRFHSIPAEQFAVEYHPVIGASL